MTVWRLGLYRVKLGQMIEPSLTGVLIGRGNFEAKRDIMVEYTQGKDHMKTQREGSHL
jgi:hypothetical protein